MVWKPACTSCRALSNANLIYHPSHSAIVGQPAGDSARRASRTRWSSSAAPFRPAAGWAIKNPPNSARNTSRRFSTRSSSTTCRSGSTCSASPRRCPRKSPTPRTGCIRRTDTRTPPCRGSGCPTHPTSHRNTQHGWITAPGMQGVKVGPVTAGLLTPESLAELMGGPDIAPVQSNLQTPPGYPNAYDEAARTGALSSACRGIRHRYRRRRRDPSVIPGPVAPTPAPGPSPLSGQAPGPPLPAEAASAPGGGQ